MFEKILLMSDLHLTEPSQTIVGLCPKTRLEACLDHAALHHPDARHLFLMGDLTHHGLELEYEILMDILKTVPFTTTLMLGNHDRRSNFLAVFPKKSLKFQQGYLDIGRTRVVYLDTLNEIASDKHSGLLCQERVDWLTDTLERSPFPVVVLAHHHMLPSGFDGMDQIMLKNSEVVASILADSGKCQMVVNGHIHRIIFGQIQGVPHAMIKSPCHQMPMILGAAGSSLSVDEPGGYGVLLLDGQTPILHHVDVGLRIYDMAQDPSS